MVNDATPGLAVSCKGRPLMVVYVTVVKATSSDGPCSASLVLVCHDGQWRVRRTGQSWADVDLSFWRRALPIGTVTSAT